MVYETTISRSLTILGVNSLDCQFVCRGFACGGLPAGGEYFRSHVAAGFGPFVVLLGQDRADEADDRVAVREDPDDVGSSPYFLVEAFLRYLEPQPMCP
jgi:hypothetical protein